MSLALVMALSLLSSIPTQAKTNRITLKHQTATSTTSVANRKSTRVNVGSYIITMNNKKNTYEGYAKFIAPEARTYYITISNLKTNTKVFSTGSVSTMKATKQNKKMISFTNIVSSSPNRNRMWISTQKQADRPTSCTGRITLKNGEALYLYFSFSGFASKKATTKLVIK